MKTLVTLFDTALDLSHAVEDLVEATHTLEDTWNVLGDATAYAWMSEEQAVAQWELDLRAAVQEEQWVLGHLDEVQKRMGRVNEQWVALLTESR